MAQTKPNGTLRITVLLLAALGVPAGGIAGYYKLQSDVEWACKHHEQLRAKHEVDMQTCEVKFNTLKSALDSIATRGASSEAKLDMLVQMVRDMRTRDMR